MKKIFSILFALMLISSQARAVDEFLSGEPAGTRAISTIDDYVEDNNIALERLLFKARRGAEVIYASSSSVSVAIGEVACSNAAGTVLHTRANTSAVTVTFADLDTGSEAASTTYYVYADGDADTATFTCKLSISSTSPTGVTYYKKLGSFYNNSSSNIERIDNLGEDLSMWEQDGDEVQLKQADNIDAQSMNIVNLLDPVNDQDAATKVFVETSAGLADGAVTQAKLATTTGEVSTTEDATNYFTIGKDVTSGFYITNINIMNNYDASAGALTLPGGSYGFYPQIKQSGASCYAQQRYVTASGIDYWLFILIDKSTKDILSAWGAPDHCSYGQNLDYVELPHPFGNYNKNEHFIILVEDENRKELQAEAKEKDVSLLTLINEDYAVNYEIVEKYKPLHTGKFLGEAPILVPAIPDYIKVRKLRPLTNTEKLAREEKRDADRIVREGKELKLKNDKKTAKQKLETLGLTKDELEAIGIK